MTAAKLERSHGKLRAVAQRPSDQKPVDTAARRDRDHHPNGWFKKGNQAARGGRAKHASTKHMRAARIRLRAARSRGETPSREDVLLDAALSRYDAARKELGAESVLVLTPLARWAEDEERIIDLAEQAERAGIGTPEGARLMSRRDALEGRANRAMTAALAAAVALPTTRAPVNETAEAIERFKKGGSNAGDV